MSDENTASEEPVQASNLETQLTQLHSTFTQLWQKMKVPEPPVPQKLVVWGTTFLGQALGSSAVVAAIQTRIWFTYRAGFVPILRAEDGPGPLSFLGSMIFNALPNTTMGGVLDNQHFTTDVGWGCMIRTSQALLANTLQSFLLGHDYCHTLPNETHDKLVALFADEYSAPFSLHNFIRAASELPLQVRPGEWFGPSAASLLIKRLCERYVLGQELKTEVGKQTESESKSDHKSEAVHVIVSESGDLYDTEIEAHFTRGGMGLLVLLPVRLGIENVNSYYHSSLFQLLATRQSVGIAGGKPASSYYFFGFQDDELLYLDPHTLQAVSRDGATYHTSRCRLLPVSALDPSMLIGLAIRDWADYCDMRTHLAPGNKIVHFHTEAKRRRSTPDEDYVKVSMPEGTEALVDDFVNISDHISDTESVAERATDMAEDLDPHFGTASSTSSAITSSSGKYDVVRHADAV